MDSIPGNTIKKTYLSNANNKELAPGAILLIYCSHSKKALLR